MNKKIKNATPLEYDGVTFKSKMEVTAYKLLKDAGFSVKYEPQKIIIFEGFKPTIPFYNRNNITKELQLQMKKLIDMTYTPDFIFEYNSHTVIIEVKGFANDSFPIKRKLFRAWLEDHPECLYFEVRTKQNVLQAIEIIKSYDLVRED